MQKVLIIKIGKGKIISKPWDFEALCLVDDKRKLQGGVITRCMDAVTYLFEGTKATNEFLDGLGYKRLGDLCIQVWLWYMEDIQRLVNIQKNAPQKGGEGCLRDLYTSMFKAWGILGSELGKQKPEHIFMLLKPEKEENTMDDIPEASRCFYGL